MSTYYFLGTFGKAIEQLITPSFPLTSSSSPASRAYVTWIMVVYVGAPPTTVLQLQNAVNSSFQTL